MEIKYLEVLVMDNTEIICLGKTVGFTDKLDRFLFTPNQIVHMEKIKREQQEKK